MDAIIFFVFLLQSIIQLPQKVGYELDEATRERMQQREEHLSREMARLLWEMEQSSSSWGALLFAALQQWQLWAIAALLVLLFGLCWWLWKTSHQPESSSEQESSSSNTERKEKESEEDSDEESDLFRIFGNHLLWSVQSLSHKSQVVEDLVDDLLAVLQENLATSFFPVLHPAIGVGSTFEGWSPREYDAVYRMLVPLKPPHGHTFHLELGSARQTPEKNSRIRVELECTCTREQLVENTLCFLHHPQKELRRNPAASLLGTLCTGSYLDVLKTAQWFQNLVRSAWGEMPQSRRYSMKLLPSRRSCKLQLTNDSGRRLSIEMVFGVQQGDSDIFLSSHTTEDSFIPSTMWAESYAVAEVKFFRHIATQAPHDTFHLKCLQLYTGILGGKGFSNYIMKTVAMHLLNTIPLANWSRMEFLMRLEDILRYLHSCLEDKRLDHFFFGNQNMPEDIILPPEYQTAQPINLLQHLLQDPAAHAKAMREFDELQYRLTRLLFYGQ